MSRRPRRAVRRRRRGGHGGGGITRVLNRERDRRVTSSKTLVSTFSIGTSYNATFNAFWKFDPSGTYGTSQGTPAAFAPSPINDWNNFIRQYFWPDLQPNYSAV